MTLMSLEPQLLVLLSRKIFICQTIKMRCRRFFNTKNEFLLSRMIDDNTKISKLICINLHLAQ